MAGVPAGRTAPGLEGTWRLERCELQGGSRRAGGKLSVLLAV